MLCSSQFSLLHKIITLCFDRDQKLLRRWLQKNRRDRRRHSDLCEWRTVHCKECT